MTKTDNIRLEPTTRRGDSPAFPIGTPVTWLHSGEGVRDRGRVRCLGVGGERLRTHRRNAGAVVAFISAIPGANRVLKKVLRRRLADCLVTC
jgi:hypothetical protein